MLHRIPFVVTLAAALALGLHAAQPLGAQGVEPDSVSPAHPQEGGLVEESPSADPIRLDTRLYGTVFTVQGEALEGYIRWADDGLVGADLIESTRTLSPERAQLIRRARGDEEIVRRRVVTVEGYRVSWDEVDPEFAVRLQTGVQLGLVDSVRRFEERSLLVTLRSGQVVEFRVPDAEGGPGYDQIRVVPGDGREVTVPWGEVDRVEFAPEPEQGSGAGDRLYGTVEDRWGERWTGFVTWDAAVATLSDSITTREGRRRDGDGLGRAQRLDDVVELRRLAGGETEVVLESGEVRTMGGTRTSGRRHRGVQVVSPEWGRVRIPWSDFRSLSLQDDPSRTDAPGAPAVGLPPLGRLSGTLTTRSGEALTGWIIWDGDESWGWELLDGEWRGIEFSLALSQVASVRRLSSESAEATLASGRVLELRGSNDVSDENRGVFVLDATADPADGTANWRRVDWDDLEEVRFHGVR